MSNLVLFTNRSGSTILADLLAYVDGSVNLGEGLHSVARDYNYNTEANRQTKLYQEFSKESLTGLYHSRATRGSDYVGFFEAKQKRIDLLKNTTEQWTVKENIEKLTIDIPFIEYCANAGVDIWLTHRKDIVSQFISKINARYRSEVANHKHDSNFIYTNHCTFTDYDTIKIKFHWLHMYTNVFLEQLMLWRIIYERFKSYPTFKIVDYENEIEPMALEECGIGGADVMSYRLERNHLIPTPHNATNVIVEDDHKKPITGAWKQSLYYIERHKYLVEV